MKGKEKEEGRGEKGRARGRGGGAMTSGGGQQLQPATVAMVVVKAMIASSSRESKK